MDEQELISSMMGKINPLSEVVFHLGVPGNISDPDEEFTLEFDSITFTESLTHMVVTDIDTKEFISQWALDEDERVLDADIIAIHLINCRPRLIGYGEDGEMVVVFYSSIVHTDSDDE